MSADRTSTSPVAHQPVRRFGLAVIAALILVLFASLPASANYQWLYAYDGVNIRQGPYTSYTSNGLGYTGQIACAHFEATGETINGNPYWLNHKNLSTAVTGYSAEAYLTFNSPNTCTP